MAKEPNYSRKGNMFIHRSPNRPIVCERKPILDDSLTLTNKLVYVFICALEDGGSIDDIYELSSIDKNEISASIKTLNDAGYINMEG